MAGYEELKSELEVVAKIVEKFPETVKPRVFELLVQTFLGQSPTHANPTPNGSASASAGGHGTRKASGTTRGASAKRKMPSMQAPDSEQPSESGTTEHKKAPRRAAGKESYQIDRELNLRGDKSIPAFTVFVEEKKPDTNQEFNAVVVYYLQKMLGHPSVTLDQAYTCFREARRRPPDAFKQSFIDTKNRKGWVEFNAAGNLRIPHRGAVFVEHDLPKPPKAKAQG